MHASIHAERTLTELDFSRLVKLFGGQLPPDMADLLSATDVIPSRDVPATIVTMYSQVELVDTQTLRRHIVTICYPSDADPVAGFISVLSPVVNGCPEAHFSGF